MDKYEALFPIPVPHEENVERTTEHMTENDNESLPKGKVNALSLSLSCARTQTYPFAHSR